MVNMLDFANPYIVAGTPLLYNTTANATSYTPAWKDSLWSVRLLTQFCSEIGHVDIGCLRIGAVVIIARFACDMAV